MITLPLCSENALDATSASLDPTIAATALSPATAETAPPTAPLPAIANSEPPVLVASREEPPANETEPALPVAASAEANVTSPDAPFSAWPLPTVIDPLEVELEAVTTAASPLAPVALIPLASTTDPPLPA
jgi:hypothetical protein